MDKVFFVSGGSEAVESAIKLARQYAVTVGQGSRWKVISRFPSPIMVRHSARWR
jgi:adenosylmethionine-8-amino-7-oxononanoate aminotransferase